MPVLGGWATQPEEQPPYGGLVSNRPDVSVPGLVLALLGTAGLSLGMALLYQGMALIMETEGAFVASGGPYEIAHPAPGWAWLLPVSIWVALLFGAMSVVASLKGWGVNLIVFAWSGLFFSLGWNFLRFGLNPPEFMSSTWGWIVPGVIFWLMALMPLVMLLIGAILRRRYLDPTLRTPRASAVLGFPAFGEVEPAYVVAQGLGIAAGIAGGIALFTAVTS